MSNITYRKYVVQQKPGQPAWGVIIPNNYHHLDGYMRLFEEAKKDFPLLQPEDVECSIVAKSHWCEGMPIIRFNLPPDTKMVDWSPMDSLANRGVIIA